MSVAEGRVTRVTIRIAQLQLLCALLMLRMTHGQLLRALFAGEDCPQQEPDDGGEPNDEGESDDEGEPRECCDGSLDSDRSLDLYFAALQEGTLTNEGVEGLARHIGECDTCKMLFALMLDDVRRTSNQTTRED